MVLCHVFLELSRLFIAALWLSAGKRLTSWLWLMMFIVFLLCKNQLFEENKIFECIFFDLKCR